MLLLVWPIHLAYSQSNRSKEDSIISILHSKCNDTTRINSLINLTQYVYLKNPDTAIVICRQAQQLSERINYKPGKADVYIWLGYLIAQSGGLEEGLEYYLKSLKMKQESGDKDGIAANYHNIAGIYQRQGKIVTALEFYQKSLHVLREIDDKHGITFTLNNIGFIYRSQGNVAKALEYYLKSLKIGEQTGDKHEISESLLHIGRIYFDQDELEKALEYFQRSLKLSQDIGDKKSISSSLSHIAALISKKGDDEEALKYLFECMELDEEIGNKIGIARNLSSIGITFKNQGKLEKALPYCLKSLKIKEEIGYKFGISSSLSTIGSIYFKLGNITKARACAKKSLSIGRELESAENIRSAAVLLTRIYRKQKKWKDALEMYELYIQMRDSVKNEETHRVTIKQNMKYEYEKKAAADSIKSVEQKKVLDAQITAQQAMISQEKTFKYSLYGGLALVILFSFFVINRLKVTRAQKSEIELKNNALNNRNDEIAFQKEIVEQKNTEILDSITYAERIQSAILPPLSLVKRYLPQSFVFYKPKDIVAGDFYWLEAGTDKKENCIYFSAADCTGHGVPGAMMSVMCSNALTRCVKELELTKPGEILDETTRIIEGRFERSEQLVLDGMDLALCKLDLKTNKLEYAGANNPLWIVHREFKNESEQLVEIKADKQPIGQYDDRKPYTSHKIQLNKGDSIYIFTDGFVDQFGGERGKKFKKKSFAKLLLSIQDKPMLEQLDLIKQAFDTWKGKTQQIDDVCIIGVKI